jgi:4-hydroxy-2-oxoheptanedioate aldolase
MKPSKVLAKLRSGRPAICVKSNLMDSRVIDIMGIVGFDCTWLCNEHVPTDWYTIENQIRASKMHDMDCIVRVSKGSYSDYVRPLEADATGIMVPHVFTADEARNIVRMTKFMPVGRRPIDGGNADGNYCMTPVEEYVKAANRERFVMIQIEDPEPMEQLDDICAVEGFEIVFFGPSDFTHGSGLLPQLSHPDVLSARRRIAESARKHGKWAGTMASVDNIEEIMDEGYQFLAVGADVVALGNYFRDIRVGLERKRLI